MLTVASKLDVMHRLGRAMADPTRSRILLRLLDGPSYPAALADEFGLTRQNVSNHLACLRDCGIVVAEPEGRQSRYEISDPLIAHALTDLLSVVLQIDEDASTHEPVDAHRARGVLLMTIVERDARTETLRRRIRWIVAGTIGYNVIEAIVALSSGFAASSAALIGFGLDSVIEVLSAAAVAWQFTRRDPDRWEKPTLRVIALSFFLLAAYVAVNAVLSLAGVFRPEHSTVGIVLTALSVVIMPLLSLAEYRTGRELGSATAVADSRQTLICAALSVAVLLGLVLNSLWGLWWADAVAALVIVGFAVREGIEAWRGDTCATPIGMLLDEDGDEHEDHS